MISVSRPALLPALAEDDWPESVEVVIVGGGPVGLSAAILLAQRGIDVLLLERRSFDSRFPRAHLLNVRTMEVFHEMGVADDIYALAPADDRWRKVVWYTSVTGPTALHGLKLGEVQAWGGGPDAVRYAEASPMRFSNLPQIRLDPLLRDHAAAACPGRIRSGCEVTGIEQDGARVTATFRDRAAGRTRQIVARYLIAADGGRVSPHLLGVELDGPRAINRVVSFYVSTDLSMWSEPDALLVHFLQPGGRGRLIGTAQALGPGDYGRGSPEWLVAVAAGPAGTEPPDDDTLLLRARDMLGVATDHPITVHSVSHWNYEGVVARRFRVGAAFLAGDAAHKHPPTGGLGLNGGVQDAHNLCWKLAAVLRGRADEALLDTYEQERRPVTAHNTAHSLENAGRHAPIGAALGFGPDVDDEEGWAQVAVFASDTPAGEQRRQLVAETVAANADDYSQLNVEAGYAYVQGALIPDGTAPPPSDYSPIDYRPTTRPGHHLPHVWLRHVATSRTDRPVSTLDLVTHDGFTLFVDSVAADDWREAASRIDGTTSLPVTVVAIPAEDRDWVAAREVGDGGAVLVRPDRTISWRVTALPHDPVGALLEALKILTSCGSVGDDDPAEPYLERIHAAAARLAH